MKLKSNFLLGIIAIALVIGIGFFVFAQGNLGNYTGMVVNAGNENVQIIKLHVEGNQYVLEPNTVKEGIPVQIVADISRTPGCSKSIVLSGFNIRKSVSEKDNVIEFTPDKSGTFNIACSMNMYQGKLIVLSSGGVKSNYVEAPSISDGTCGASGRGCGG